MSDIELGQVRKGTVKNIAEFGAFVDLGGIDGLLHITDMSWDRIVHPSELLKIDQEIEIKVLSIDKEKEKVALGMKQLQENPWENIEERYPINGKVTGAVVNIVPYGAFVKLEAGVEGLVHISEMSWTRRINHPSEMLKEGEDIEVIVLEGQQGISRKSRWASSRPRSTPGRRLPRSTRRTPVSPAAYGT